MTTREALTKLLEVQALDITIVDLHRRQESIPAKRAHVAQEITTLETEQTQHEEGLERTRLERRAKESELETHQEQRAKYESQLNDVKTNVAYSALLTEIQGTKLAIGELEDEILNLMSANEEHENRLGEIAEELNTKRAEAADELDSLDAELGSVERELATRTANRDDLAVDVDPGLYRLYDRLRRGNRFPALVVLRGDACSACYGHLPPQVVREITHEGTLHPCEACGVLVYHDPSQAESADNPTQSADAR